MREKPIHGKRYILEPEKIAITALGTVGRDYVKVLLPDGKIDAYPKNRLSLATIDTSAYEKIVDDKA